MGARKRISAEARKEAQKTMYFAKLNNVPTSPRKMRLVADMIRGMEVFRALGVLKFSNKEAAARVEKLLRSAIANWEHKNERLKEHTGKTFAKYVEDLRVEQAKKLLKETSFSNEKIAEAAGFGSANSFYRVFKKKTGVSPGEFRGNPENCNTN